MHPELAYSGIGATGPERYELLYNELVDYIEEKAGGVNEQALRIILASLWLHYFSNELPASLWLHGCPRWLWLALKNSGVSEFGPSRASLLALYAKATTKPAVWVLREPEAIFENTAVARRAIETLSCIAGGRLSWASPENPRQMPKGALQPFIWNGRVTVLACGSLGMTARQTIGWRTVWPSARNFSELYVGRIGEFTPRQGELSVSACLEAKNISRYILNLLDFDHRMSNKIDDSARSANIFDNTLWLTRVVGAFRGSGFDADELGARAVRIAMAHASMMAKPEADAEDAGLARRLVLDALPRLQLKIAQGIPLDGFFTVEQLAGRSGVKPALCSEAIGTLLQTGALAKPEAVRRLKPVSCFRVTAEFQKSLMGGL